jgi:hypothetical protein
MNESTVESQSFRDTGAWKASVRKQTDEASLAMARNSRLNFWVRLTLYLLSAAALILALIYVADRGNTIVGTLLDSQAGKDDFNEGKLLTLIIPPALYLVLFLITLVGALLIQTRGLSDLEQGLQAISRLRREAEAGVSRTRPLTHIVEEFVSNARSAFRLQLWLSRTFFVVGVVLLFTAIIQGIVEGVNWGTATLAAGSFLALILGNLAAAAKDVGDRLGDLTQMQLVVASSTRQVDVLEEHMYKVLELMDRGLGTPEDSQRILDEEIERISELVGEALHLIQIYAEPAGSAGTQLEQVLKFRRGGGARPGEPRPPADEPLPPTEVRPPSKVPVP